MKLIYYYSTWEDFLDLSRAAITFEREWGYAPNFQGSPVFFVDDDGRRWAKILYRPRYEPDGSEEYLETVE